MAKQPAVQKTEKAVVHTEVEQAEEARLETATSDAPSQEAVTEPSTQKAAERVEEVAQKAVKHVEQVVQHAAGKAEHAAQKTAKQAEQAAHKAARRVEQAAHTVAAQVEQVAHKAAERAGQVAQVAQKVAADTEQAGHQAAGRVEEAARAVVDRVDANGTALRLEGFMKKQLSVAQKRFHDLEENAEKVIDELRVRGHRSRKELEIFLQTLKPSDLNLLDSPMVKGVLEKPAVKSMLERPAVKEFGVRAERAGEEFRRQWTSFQHRVVAPASEVTQSQVKQLGEQFSRLQKRVNAFIGKPPQPPPSAEGRG